MSALAVLDRRQFLALGASVGFGLAFRWGDILAKANAPAARFEPNAFISIDNDGFVTLTVHRSEMGQGIRTTIAMILAEELDADWGRIRVRQAVGDARYGDQNTVGDLSLLLGWDPLRTAAATGRAMLIGAAARLWSVPLAEIETRDSVASHAASGKRIGYGDLAALAMREDIPSDAQAKSPSSYRLIGTARSSIDLDALTRGGIKYGIDVRRERMLYATVVRAPVVGGRIRSFDDSAARKTTGYFAAFPLEGAFRRLGETRNGVAIVGADTWSCLVARRAISIDWDLGSLVAESDESLGRRLDEALAKPGAVYRSAGDVDEARSKASRVMKRRYSTPFLVHAPLEPPNCTADVRPDRCEVWAPTQDPQTARAEIASELGLPIASVTVNVTFIGGAFGRKSLCDFVLEAVRISRQVQRPVKLLWTREDDIRDGFYKSRTLQELEAGIDHEGRVTFWRHHTAFATWNTSTEDPASHELSAGDMSDGVTRFPYAIPNLRFEGTHVEMPVRRSWMRGISSFFHSFATNSFIDELARETGRDPIDMRLSWLGPLGLQQALPTGAAATYWLDTARIAATIARVREISQWNTPLSAGRGRGFAVERLSGTVVATVAEITLEEDGFRVDRIFSVADCGIVINPDGARAQIEGGTIFALSCCLYGEITLKDGSVVQDNFASYPIARMHDAPVIVADLIQSDRAPTGLGEPPVPPVAPAVANAVAAAGGKRLADMPFYSRTRRGLA